MGKTEVEEPPRGTPWDNALRDAPLVFLDLEMHALSIAGAVREHGRRLDGEVAAIGRQG